MSINRRQFLRKSLAGSAAIVVGKDLSAASTPAVSTSFPPVEDLSPPAKGKSVFRITLQTIEHRPCRCRRSGQGSRSRKTHGTD